MNECMTQEEAMNMNNEQAVQILKPLRNMMCDQYGCPISDAVFALDKAICALQTERKKGKWIEPSTEGCVSYDKRAYAECSICGSKIYFGWKMNFCPNCGADMRGEEDG